MPERRYDDREVALILKAATEAGVHGPGLTLEQLKDAAVEVGLDPAAVERAARALDVRASSGGAWLGAPVVHQFEQVVDGAVSEADHGALLLAIRRAMGRHGVAGTELDGLEWRARDAVGGRYVSIRPEGDRTLVRVLGNFREGAVAFFMGAGTTGWVASLIALKALGLLKPLSLVALPIMAAAALLPGWLAWRWRSRREAAALRRTLDALVDAIARRRQPEQLGSGATSAPDDSRG